MKIKEILGGIREISIESHFQNIDLKIDNQYQILEPEKLELVLVWHVDKNNKFNFKNVQESHIMRAAIDRESRKRNGNKFITLPYKLSYYTPNTPINSDYPYWIAKIKEIENPIPIIEPKIENQNKEPDIQLEDLEKYFSNIQERNLPSKKYIIIPEVNPAKILIIIFKVIGSIITALIIAYLVFRFGWNK